MFRDKALGLTFLAMLLTSLACNAFAGELEPFPPPPTTVIETEENGDSFAPVATATLPGLSPVESARLNVLVDLNVRSGPGVQYERVGFILKDEIVPIIGIHKPTGWWKIACPSTTDETDCWVSGSAQYTQAEFVENVAELEAPPTLTPAPPELEEGLGILAFIDGGQLFVAQIDITQNPPLLAADPIQLSDIESIQRLFLSPDGRRVAFISETADGDRLYVINIDGQGLRELLVSGNLPIEARQEQEGDILWIDQLSWFPDSSRVAFNSTVTNQSTPGILSQEDLWTVTLDGERAQIFSSGTGGGAFSLLSNNAVLLSRSDNIARANLDGTIDEVLLQFDPVNTASEYVYYPMPQPAGQGDTFLSIPDAQPWQPGAWTTLWQISASGLTRQLGVVEGANLFDPLVWSPDGAFLAFTQQIFQQESSQMPRLMIADARGINAHAYTGDNSLVFHSWSPDSSRFLYSGDGYYAIGGVNAPPLQTKLAEGQHVGDAQWVSDTFFILAKGSVEDDSWELVSAADSGQIISLTTIDGFEPKFDLWLP